MCSAAVKGRVAGVVDFQLQVEAVAAAEMLISALKAWGHRARGWCVVGEAQGGEGEVPCRRGCCLTPQAVAGEAVLGQRQAAAGELGKHSGTPPRIAAWRRRTRPPG